MGQSAGQIFGKLGWDALPFTIGTGTFFAGNFVATGSVLEAAEIGALAGFGAGIAMTGLIVVGAVAVPIAIALTLGNNKAAGDMSDAVHAVAPLISPGTIGLLPVSGFVTPEDPTLFARAFGPGIDLTTGVMSSSTVDKLGAELGGLAAFQGWKSDVINLGDYFISSQTAPSLNLGQSASPSRPNPPPASTPRGGDDGGLGGGFPFDLNAPGDGDTHSESPDTTSSVDSPTFYMSIELSNPGASGAAEGESTQGNADASAETQPGSDDTNSSEDNGTGSEQTGLQSGGDGQPSGNPNGGEEGGGEDSGGPDEGGGDGPDD
jgi:hypothetical protein